MVYPVSNNASSMDDDEPQDSAVAPFGTPAARYGDPEKSEVSALLRMLTHLANCGLDAGAKPLLHSSATE